MTTTRRPGTRGAPEVIQYGGIDHTGPASIYRSAIHQPAVSLATFSTRFRRLIERNALSVTDIDEALWSNASDFRRKYGTRRTLIQVDGQPTDLQVYFTAKSAEATVNYRVFWQRVRALTAREKLSSATLLDALGLPPAAWKSYYGGGRRSGFIYQGDEYPEHSGKHFHSVTAFLRTTGRYGERGLIWSRLKAGWSLDDALIIPTSFESHRTGLIYRIIRRTTGSVYVGLTVSSIEQRWAFHVRSAKEGSTTKLHAAIREDGPNGFDVDVLECNITDLAQLPAREAHWVEHLNALGSNGLNSAKPGGLGSPRGKHVRYGDETFRSIEEAADVLGQRLNIAQHVIRSRLQKGLPLPEADQVRRHSKHPEAGSNLFRRWLGMLKRHAPDVASEWVTDYDRFKADISPIPEGMELVRKRPEEPWCPDNVEWVSTQTKVERIHGKAVTVGNVVYPSLAAVAKTHGIGVSTLKHRVNQQGMSIAEAVAAPLSSTSYKQGNRVIMVDGHEFRSKRQAILYIAETRGITEHQAKYRLDTNTY